MNQTLRDILNEAAVRLRDLPTARRDAELLLMRVTARNRAWLLTHMDAKAELSSEQMQQFESWIARRVQQEPVQYILGETEFFGLTLRVTPDVLIPRPETEHLVEAAIERLASLPAPRIVDVGTGSGAIAVTLAHALPRAEVTALDISAAALAVARQNAQRHGVEGRMRFLTSDLLEAVRGERFDAVVSNPPYVADAEVLEAQVAEYEPHGALFAGPTGLEVYRRLIPQAWDVLGPIPQGLKPQTRVAGCGTTEVVPLQSTGVAAEGTPAAGYGTAKAVPFQGDGALSGSGIDVPSPQGGWLLMEIGHGQREALAELLSVRQPGFSHGPGWEAVEFVADLQGIPRVAIARRAAGE